MTWKTCEVAKLTHTSDVLRENPLNDPHIRDLFVLTPPDGLSPGERLPVVYLLAGYGARGCDLISGNALARSLPQLLGPAMEARQIPRAHVVLPDCSTRYGGSQYLDSPRCGRYQSYLIDELVPFVDETFPTLGARYRAIIGKSSGGYGAIMTAMCRPGLFDAVCAHSPDAGFEFSYLPLLPKALDTYRAHGGLGAFIADPRAIFPKDSPYMIAMSLLAMALCYAPATATELAEEFPCDPESGVFRDDVWHRWLALDPVRIVAEHAPALAELRLLFLDAGDRDDYAMNWGARALHATLGRADIPHVYEEYPGGHHGVEHRLLRSLAALSERWRL
jgi:enterochelin esterase family protein